MPKVICGFPGVGKSSVSHKFGANRVSDSDSSKFDKAYFPQNYIEHIATQIPQRSYVLVSSHDNVREALVQNEIDFALVYPDRSLKDEYMTRYRERGSPKPFLDLMDKNWDSFIDSCEAQTGCQKVILSRGQFLADLLT